MVLAIAVNAQHEDVAPGLTKDKHRNLIDTKMDEIINRIKIQTECQEEITYTVVDTYLYYKDQKKNLPKTVIFEACDQKLTYINYLAPIYSATVGGWYTATWTLDATSK
ncbi:MAG: hypothetical protein AAF487_09795 [Bacteroidota bacterium]